MDFGAMMQMLQGAQPTSLGALPTSLPGGLTSANVDQYAPGQIQAPGQSSLAALGSAFQANGQTSPLPPLPSPEQHRSAFLMNILPQLMQSIGQGNMLGRMGSM